MVQSADIIILSNGPGEVTTWVRPVVQQLAEQLGKNRALFRISVILSPCPHATGKEAAIARSYAEVDRVQESEYFWQFLLWGKTAENWDWREKGIVVFLGGDQIFPVIIGKKLGYRTVIYAEWEARWHQWIDRFGVMKPDAIASLPKKYAHKFTVVGDLMADVATNGNYDNNVGIGLAENPAIPQTTLIQNPPLSPSIPQTTLIQNLPFSPSPSPSFPSPSPELIGLLPGSKSAKLTQGLPLTLAIAECIRAAKPQTRFILPVAPTLDAETLARYANPQHNPLIQKLGWSAAELQIDNSHDEKRLFLKTPKGLLVELLTQFPAHNAIAQCRLCLTTVGANTAELGSLAVPMIILLPTQQLDAMRSWDGLPGILANLPILGSALAKAINWLMMQKKRLYAWPNIWAGEEIVPELLGELQPAEVAKMVVDWLDRPEKLEQMRDRLRAVRGPSGASQKLAQLVLEELYSLSKPSSAE